MVDYDPTGPDDILVKVRRANDNAKIPRRPHTLEVAIEALFLEGLSLTGEDFAYSVMGRLTEAYAREKDFLAGENGEHVLASTVAAGIEMLVNMNGKAVADLIVSELRDMELLA